MAHSPSQAGAAKRANEDEDPGPVETVGAEVIHICWLLDSGHAGVWEWDWLVGHYEKVGRIVIG